MSALLQSETPNNAMPIRRVNAVRTELDKCNSEASFFEEMQNGSPPFVTGEWGNSREERW